MRGAATRREMVPDTLFSLTISGSWRFLFDSAKYYFRYSS